MSEQTPDPLHVEETSEESPPQVVTEAGASYVHTEETSEEAPVLGEIVTEHTALPDTLTASQAAELLGVSARRVRQFVQEGRLSVARQKPLAVTLSSVENLAGERSGGGAVAMRSASTGLQNFGAIVEVLRSEHAATLAAMEARTSDLIAHRDSLTEQVEHLRSELDRERSQVQELAQKVEDLSRRRWWNRR